MDQRISFITLVVRDLQASRDFYVNGLGWETDADVVGEVLMFQVGEKLMLSLWDEAAAVKELGAVNHAGTVPLTLAHNVATKEGVDRVLAQAAAAGAETVADGQDRDWGGYTGYFADPDGFRWEVAYNPSEIGRKVLP